MAQIKDLSVHYAQIANALNALVPGLGVYEIGLENGIISLYFCDEDDDGNPTDNPYKSLDSAVGEIVVLAHENILKLTPEKAAFQIVGKLTRQLVATQKTAQMIDTILDEYGRASLNEARIAVCYSHRNTAEHCHSVGNKLNNSSFLNFHIEVVYELTDATQNRVHMRNQMRQREAFEGDMLRFSRALTYDLRYAFISEKECLRKLKLVGTGGTCLHPFLLEILESQGHNPADIMHQMRTAVTADPNTYQYKLEIPGPADTLIKLSLNDLEYRLSGVVVFNASKPQSRGNDNQTIRLREHTISIRGQNIPATITQAMAGRPVTDIVKHPLFNGKIIRSAGNKIENDCNIFVIKMEGSDKVVPYRLTT